MSTMQSSSLPIDYAEWRPGTAVGAGQAMILPAVYSPHLANTRPVLVYLPRSYRSDMRARFPVVYMHDGQNLLDPATSYIRHDLGPG